MALCLWETSIYQFLVQVWILLLAATASVTFLLLPNLLPRAGIFEGPNELAIWGSKIWGMWWVGKSILNYVITSCILNLCMVMHCHVEVGLQPIFCRSNSLEMLLQGFKSLNVQIGFNCLTTWHNVYQNNSLLHHEDKWPWLFLLNG